MYYLDSICTKVCEIKRSIAIHVNMNKTYNINVNQVELSDFMKGMLIRAVSFVSKNFSKLFIIFINNGYCCKVR